MIIRIILCVCVIPILPIMYVVFAGMGKVNNGSLFGITLWKNAMEDERVHNLIRGYKKQLKWITILLIVVHFLVYLPTYFSIMMILWMLWMFAAIFVISIPYIRANKKLRELKMEHQLLYGESTQNNVYVDVTAAIEEKPKYFQKSGLAACIACFIPVILEAILYKSINSLAAPELWVAEFILISIASVGILCFWLICYYDRQPVTVLTADSQVNLQFSRIRKYQWSRCFHAMAWITATFNGMLLVSFYLVNRYTMLFLIMLCLLYCITLIVLCIFSWHTISRQKEKLLEGKELLLSEDDDNWIWGMIYYNKNDSRFMVEKKVGIGMTTNMAKPAAIIMSIATGILILVMLVGGGIWIVVDEFTPVSLNYEKNQLIARHVREEYRIDKANIVSVTLLEDVPSMSRQNGTGLDNVYKGTFFSRQYDRRFQVCLNPEEEPVMMIEDTDGIWYLLGDSQSEHTKKIYRELIR